MLLGYPSVAGYIWKFYFGTETSWCSQEVQHFEKKSELFIQLPSQPCRYKMARIKNKSRLKGKRFDHKPMNNINEEKKEVEKIYKFSPQVVGQSITMQHSPASKKKSFAKPKLK